MRIFVQPRSRESETHLIKRPKFLLYIFTLVTVARKLCGCVCVKRVAELATKSLILLSHAFNLKFG